MLKLLPFFLHLSRTYYSHNRQKYRNFHVENRCCLRARGIYVGSFDDGMEAAIAYDRKAAELFGEFAYLNFAKGRGQETGTRGQGGISN